MNPERLEHRIDALRYSGPAQSSPLSMPSQFGSLTTGYGASQ